MPIQTTRGRSRLDARRGCFVADGRKVTKDETNKIIGPVHSEYGYHILMITEVKVENSDTQQVDLSVISPEELHNRISSGWIQSPFF